MDVRRWERSGRKGCGPPHNPWTVTLSGYCETREGGFLYIYQIQITVSSITLCRILQQSIKNESYHSSVAVRLMPLIEVVGLDPGVIAFLEITMDGYSLSRLMNSFRWNLTGSSIAYSALAKPGSQVNLGNSINCVVYALLGITVRRKPIRELLTKQASWPSSRYYIRRGHWASIRQR